MLHPSVKAVAGTLIIGATTGLMAFRLGVPSEQVDALGKCNSTHAPAELVVIELAVRSPLTAWSQRIRTVAQVTVTVAA